MPLSFNSIFLWIYLLPIRRLLWNAHYGQCTLKEAPPNLKSLPFTFTYHRWSWEPCSKLGDQKFEWCPCGLGTLQNAASIHQELEILCHGRNRGKFFWGGWRISNEVSGIEHFVLWDQSFAWLPFTEPLLCARPHARHRGDSDACESTVWWERHKQETVQESALSAVEIHREVALQPTRRQVKPPGGNRTSPPSSNYLRLACISQAFKEKKKVCISKACFVSVLPALWASIKQSKRREAATSAHTTQVWKLIKQQLAAQLTPAPGVDYLNGNPSYNLPVKWILQLEEFSALL